MFGGLRDGTFLDDTMAFDGRGLIDFVGAGPTPVQSAAMCRSEQPGTLVLFGGRLNGGRLSGDTWRYRDGQWSLVRSAGPSGRWLSAMVLDSFRGVVVLHGGGDLSGRTSDTWEYVEGRGWSQQSASGPVRTNHAMAFDSRRRVSVLFGGYDFGSMGDVWEYSGSRGWVRTNPGRGPSARHNHAMCYDAARGQVVVFGGKDDNGTLSDEVWEYDGAQWLSFTPSVRPAARELCTLTYDEARRRSVLIGGDTDVGSRGSADDVWEWDGSSWTQRLLAPPPSDWPAGRSQHDVAFDVIRCQTVLHGGVLANGSFSGETWIHDGATWSQHSGAVTPGPRFAHRMANMLQRSRVVLFGGYGSGNVRNDTFEWNGLRWQQVTTANAPSPRVAMAMTYDLTRNRIVLFGGNAGGFSYFNDTWEYDGSNWTQRLPANAPPLRQQASIAYDYRRQRVVLYGGYGPSGPLNDTWEYDGSNWTQIAMTASPAAQFGGAMAYDSGRGVCVLAIAGNAWEYNGLNRQWVQRHTSVAFPTVFDNPMVYDDFRSACVVFFGQIAAGNLSDAVHEWNGTTWAQRPRFTLPPPRSDHGLAYEAVSGRSLLFGGHDGVSALMDTWAYDGTRWALQHPASRPPQRWAFGMTATPAIAGRLGTVWVTGGINGLGQHHGDSYVWDPALGGWRGVSAGDPLMVRQNHAMAQHPVTGHPMLFGGFSQSGAPMQDTVAFDGGRWQTLVTGISPAPRDIHAMVCDESRGRVVLFGGRGAFSQVLNDTWEFDGSSWSLVTTAIAPPPRWNHTLAYDPQRARVILSGGRDGFGGYHTDVWEFDGTSWVERQPNTSRPAQRWNAAVAFDVRRARMLLFGGNTEAGPMGDTWEYFAPTDVGTFAAWSGAQPMSVLGAPILGGTLRVSFTSELGAGVLLLAAGSSNRALLPLPPPLTCEPASLHVNVASAFLLPASGNPCISGFDVPHDPALLGSGFSLQGIGVQNSGCIKVSLPLAFSLHVP